MRATIDAMRCNAAILLAAVLLCGCATGHGVQVMAFSTGCLSGCQAYSVEVYQDGWVEYVGYYNVPRGWRSKYVSRAQLAALDRVFEASGFARFDKHAMSCAWTDLGTLVSIDYGGDHVSFFDLCDRVPDRALDLARRIRLTLGLDRWLTEH